MQNIPLLLLTAITLFLLLPACEKKTVVDDDMVVDDDTAPNPDPDLCAETDNCDDGILDELLQTWTPVGGIFEGQDLTHGCVDTLCPDIEFTFLGDSTYLLIMTTVVQDSSGVSTQETVETGFYQVKDCDCRQFGNSWDGFYTNKDGKIHCSPAGGDTYEINFLRHPSGVFLTQSTRDSTFLLFLD